MIKRSLIALVVASATLPPLLAVAEDTPPVVTPVLDNGGLLELLNRVEQLQAEVQQLRGVVEEQSQIIVDLQRKQTNMYSDLDSRLQALTPANATATPAPIVGGATPVAAAASGVVTPPANPAATAPPAQAVAQTAASGASSTVIANTGSSNSNLPTPAPTTAVNTKGFEKERYQFAYETLRGGHYEQSVKLFENLLADFPNGEYADNAQYWLGEAYKINRETDKARAAFNKVLTQYPNSMKASDSMLKLGYIEFEAQNMPKAREILNRVVNTYPGTPAAYLASKKLLQIP